MQEHRPFLPYGFQFRPSDEELMQRYLKHKVSGTLDKIVPFVGCFIGDCDLYDKQPSEIWTSHGGPLLNVDEDLYFFTQLKKKSPKSSRINRKVGSSSGAWQGETGAEDIVTPESQQIIGYKKRFRYEDKGSEDHGGWIMHEYTLHPSMMPPNQATDYVLCRLRKNRPTGKQQNLALPKKRKVLDAQNNQSQQKLTQQINSVECQSEAAGSWVTVPQEEARCSRDSGMTSELVVSAHQRDFNSDTLERNETSGTDYAQNADEQCGMPGNMILSNHRWVPHNGSETTGGIDCSGDIHAVAARMGAPDQIVQEWSTSQQECSDSDPLRGLTDEEMSFLRKAFPGAECEEAMAIVVEQEARCNTSMMTNEQSLSGNNGLPTGGMDYSSSAAEQQPEAASNWRDQIIQRADGNSTQQVNNQLIGVKSSECQRQATMEMVREFEQISSDNPSASENGNLEGQGTGGTVYDVPMKDEILQSQGTVEYEEWSDGDLFGILESTGCTINDLLDLTDEDDFKFS